MIELQDKSCNKNNVCVFILLMMRYFIYIYNMTLRERERERERIKIKIEKIAIETLKENKLNHGKIYIYIFKTNERNRIWGKKGIKKEIRDKNRKTTEASTLSLFPSPPILSPSIHPSPPQLSRLPSPPHTTLLPQVAPNC